MVNRIHKEFFTIVVLGLGIWTAISVLMNILRCIFNVGVKLFSVYPDIGFFTYLSIFLFLYLLLSIVFKYRRKTRRMKRKFGRRSSIRSSTVISLYGQYVLSYVQFLNIIVTRTISRSSKLSEKSVRNDLFSNNNDQRNRLDPSWIVFLRSAIRFPNLRNTLLALQCCDEKNQRVFGVRGFGNSMSFIVTSREMINLFVDLCGRYKRYSPFYIDVKFLIGHFYIITVAVKNIFLVDERALGVMYMICGSHSTEDFFHLLNYIHNHIHSLSMVKVGVADLERAIYLGVEKHNGKNGCATKMIACWIHFMKTVYRWLDDHDGRFSHEEEEVFVDALFGQQSIYRGSEVLYFEELNKVIDDFGPAIKKYFLNEHHDRFPHYIFANKKIHCLDLEHTSNLVESIHHVLEILKAGRTQSILKTTKQLSSKISSDVNDWKRIVLGGGNGEIKLEFQNIKTKYLKLYKKGSETIPVVKYSPSSDYVLMCSEDLLEEVMDILILSQKEKESLCSSLENLCLYASFLMANEFFAGKKIDGKDCFVYQIFDCLGVEKRLISLRIGKHLKDIKCEVHGDECLCAHVILGLKMTKQLDQLNFFGKEVDSFHLIEERKRKTSQQSGKKPGQSRRVRNRIDPFYTGIVQQ